MSISILVFGRSVNESANRVRPTCCILTVGNNHTTSYRPSTGVKNIAKMALQKLFSESTEAMLFRGVEFARISNIDIGQAAMFHLENRSPTERKPIESPKRLESRRGFPGRTTKGSSVPWFLLSSFGQNKLFPVLFTSAAIFASTAAATPTPPVDDHSRRQSAPVPDQTAVSSDE